MEARSPEDLQDMYAAYFNAGDLEGIASLCEPHALWAQEASTAVGIDAIREGLPALLELRERRAQRLEPKSVKMFTTEGLALTRTLWRVEQRDRDGNRVEHELVTVEVYRQQEDGSWKYVIVAPFLLVEP